LSAISPLTSIAYSIRDPSLLAGTQNCQLSAHLPALPTASGTSAYWQVLTIVSYQPTDQHCLQHQEPQPVGRYSQLSAISPLSKIAYSIRNSSLLAGTHNCQLSAHLPALPTGYIIKNPSLLADTYNCQLSAHLTAFFAYSIRDPSLLAGTHNCQPSAHFPEACW
jgi:hypothetical protein